MKIKELTEDEVVKGPWDPKNVKPQAGMTFYDREGKKVQKPLDLSKLEKVPMYKAFGRPEYAAIRDAGFHFDEKPGYFDSIQSEINVRDLKKIEGLIGGKINSYKAEDLLKKYKDGEYYPQTDVNFANLQNDEETFIVWFPETGERFLANRTGAQKYIRMWAKLVA